MLDFKSSTMNRLVDYGEEEDKTINKWLREALGATDLVIDNRPHGILSGVAGVGKSHKVQQLLNDCDLLYIKIPAGSSPIQIAKKLAIGKYISERENRELIVVLDDADDIVFKNPTVLNTWKVALDKTDTESGKIPYYHHPKNIWHELRDAEKSGANTIVSALNKYQNEAGSLSVPMNNTRFIILCNEDVKKVYSKASTKFATAVRPVISRMRYHRFTDEVDVIWGWLAFTLGTNEPHKNHSFTNDEKIEILRFMYANKDSIEMSFRTVEDLSAAMRNQPNNYHDEWNRIV